MTVRESDRAIAKAMTFRAQDLQVGPERQLEQMAQYVAAYRMDVERRTTERALEAVLAELMVDMPPEEADAFCSEVWARLNAQEQA